MKKRNQNIKKGKYPGFLAANFVGTQCNILTEEIKSVKDHIEDDSINTRLRIDTKFDLVDYKSPVKWFTFQIPSGKTFHFPNETLLPKVQVPRVVPKRQLPRGVIEDRRLRLHSNYHLLDELDAANIYHDDLLPTQKQFYNKDKAKTIHFLPLSFFDDYNFDTYTPEVWLELGHIEGNYYPLLGRAFVPMDSTDTIYCWEYVAVYDYDKTEETWRVVCLETEISYTVSKCQLMFLAENANEFAKRLKQAIAYRNDAELRIKIDSIIDCVVLQDLQSHKPTFIFKSIRKLLRNYKSNMPFYKAISQEVYVLREQLMAYYDFDNILKKWPQEFRDVSRETIQHVMPKANLPKVDLNTIENETTHVTQLRKKIFKRTLFYIKASVEAMKSVWEECIYIQSLSLFVSKPPQPLTLLEFQNEQTYSCDKVSMYLVQIWPNKIANRISKTLRSNGKGWLDVSLKRWHVYEFSKIVRFILQVRLRMESSLGILLKESIVMFINFLTEPCQKFLKLKTNYEWPYNEFIVSEFSFPSPIFTLEIIFEMNGNIYYSTAPEIFQPTLCHIFQNTIRSITKICCIDAETMSKLHFSPNRYLLTVELVMKLYVRSLAKLELCYRKAVLPLNSYLKRYERFIDICVLNVNDYIREYELQKNTSTTVKRDIIEYRRQKNEIRRILPNNITIGPFLVRVSPLKQYMINKISEIVKRIFEYYVQRMYDINVELLLKCSDIYKEINQRPRSIEHLLKIKDFCEYIPKYIKNLRSEIHIMFLEYDLLDHFFYNISDTQFDMKWQVFAWPHKILLRRDTIREELKDNIDEFLRLHTLECIDFEEHLENLNNTIQALSLRFDPHRAIETAVEVKIIGKTIADLQNEGELLQFRQKLFGLSDYSLKFLSNLKEGFAPYRDLWIAINEFIKLEEATIGNPIIQIDLDELDSSYKEKHRTLIKSYKIFNEKPELQAVTRYYMEKMKKFKLITDCIHQLRNKYWLSMHWIEYGERTGTEIKFPSSINFLYLIRKRILQHLDLVKEISEKAESEATNLRHALEAQERLKEEQRLALLMRKSRRRCRNDIW